MREWVSGDQDGEVPACSEQVREPGQSFDDLARDLAGGNLSRRRALRLFGAALVGTVMASLPAMALAAPCPHPRKCKKRCCAETFVCVGDACVCPTGRERCVAGTLQGTETCCPEGSGCCTVFDDQGVAISSICCPGGLCIQDSATNLLTCATG
jgi:hypothetical protein